jgi:mRNA-degrading endonuclease RelE of RelBE toxin-antitoxin system
VLPFRFGPIRFVKAFDALPLAVQQAIERKVDDLGSRLAAYPHHRLTGRPEYRLRVGDYRVLYEFDAQQVACSFNT